MAELTEKERKDVESEMHLAQKELDNCNAQIEANVNTIKNNNNKIKDLDEKHEKNDAEIARLNGDGAKVRAKPLRAAGMIGGGSAAVLAAGYLVARFVVGAAISFGSLTALGAAVVGGALVAGITYTIATLATRKSKKRIEKQKAKLEKVQEDLKAKKDNLMLQNEKLSKRNEELDAQQNKLHEEIGGYEALLSGKVKEQNSQKNVQKGKTFQESQSDKKIKIELYNSNTKKVYPLVIDNLADAELFFPSDKKQVAYAKDFDKDDAICSYLLNKISKIGEPGEYCFMVNRNLVTKNVNGKDEVVAFSVGAMNGATKESENVRDLKSASNLVYATVEQYKVQDKKLTDKLNDEKIQPAQDKA